jgi:CheY-like chemotaxis protein
VDDNLTQCSVITEQLTHEGTEVVSTVCGTSGLAILRDSALRGIPFDAVLLDAHLPDGIGMEVAGCIQRDPALQGIQVVMLTSIDLQTDLKLCRDVEIQQYLVKPVSRGELFAMISGRPRFPIKHEFTPSRQRFTKESQRPGSGLSLNILVAEDNRVNQVVATRMLQKLGHAVTLALDGQEALKAVEQSNFDVVLMDIQMPVMDGFESTRRMRRLPNGADLHVVALTANAMAEDRERCAEAGMNDYCSKPIQQDELTRVLRNVELKLLADSRDSITPL